MTDPREDLCALINCEAPDDLVRELLAYALQELMEFEVAARTGAAKGERSPLRTAQRNGYRALLITGPIAPPSHPTSPIVSTIKK